MSPLPRFDRNGVLLMYPDGTAPLKPDRPPAAEERNDADLIASLAHEVSQLNARLADLEGRRPSDDETELKLHSLDEFMRRPTVSTYVSGIVPSKAIVIVFGPPKGGKTFSVCDLTMHAAYGRDWHGCKIGRPLKVAYLIGEGVNGFRVRLKAWMEYHDNLGSCANFKIFPLAVSLPDRALAVVEMLRDFAPDIVVTDTLNAYFGGGDENSTKDMSLFCSALRYVRDQLSCSVIVIHHTGHENAGRERGSIVLRATADVMINVGKDESNGLVGFQVIAARDMEPMESAIALKLARHETEWADAEGNPLASCIVQAAHEEVTLPGRGGKPLGDVQAIVIGAARDLAKSAKPDEHGFVVLARDSVKALAMERGAKSRTAIHNCWASLEERKYFRRIEPGSIRLRMPS